MSDKPHIWVAPTLDGGLDPPYFYCLRCCVVRDNHTAHQSCFQYRDYEVEDYHLTGEEIQRRLDDRE